MEKPNNANAVNTTDTAVTLPAPNRKVMRSDSSADTMVPAEIVMEMPPAQEIGACRSPLIVGHAAPSTASGRPRLMKAM